MKNHLLNVILLFILSLAVYGNTLGNKFVWDDELFILNNREIRTLGNIPAFFSEDTQRLYRPLRTTLYAVTYHFSGLDPVGYHLTGKTVNALTVCILYALIATLFGSPQGAFWGTIIFSLHPAHTEKVAFITSTYDIPGDLLWLSAFLFYVIYARNSRKPFLACSLALGLLGLLSAENAAVLPLVIVLYDMTLGRGERKVERWVPYFLLLAGYLAIRTHVLGTVSRAGPLLNPDLTGNFVTMSAVIIRYFRLLLVPWPLSALYEMPQLAPPYTMSAIVVTAGVAAAIMLAVYYAGKRPAISFSFLWFFFVISPNLNFIPTGTVMAERYLYLPSAMISFFVALAFAHNSDRVDENSRTRRTGLTIACAIISLLFFVGTVVRNRDWRNEPALWTATLSQNPALYMAKLNLSAELEKAGQGPAAEKLLLRASSEYPERIEAAEALTVHYIRGGNFPEAEKSLRKMSNAGNEFRDRMLLTAAFLRATQGRYDEAETTLEGLLKKYPASKKALEYNSYSLFKHGKPGWWIPLLTLHRLSGEVAPLRDMAAGFYERGDLRTAAEIANIGLSLEPENRELRSFLNARRN